VPRGELAQFPTAVRNDELICSTKDIAVGPCDSVLIRTGSLTWYDLHGILKCMCKKEEKK
jgi:hypothetical protein